MVHLTIMQIQHLWKVVNRLTIYRTVAAEILTDCLLSGCCKFTNLIGLKFEKLNLLRAMIIKNKVGLLI